jgi:lipopolysaccharide transport system ATP-binding protein
VTAVIAVEHLTKEFRIGALQRDTTLREHVMSLMRSPFKRPSRTNVLRALEDVSFDVDAGEVIGIIGRNGAGKSTLLKVLSRITYPTSGRVRVTGRLASLLEVGTGFHEELTGRENVFLNGSILGMKRGEVQAKLDAIVSYAGVERFIDTPIKRYSSGMRLRLGFAVAAHLEPDVLIVDEVLAVGDAGFQKRCLATMEGLRGGGRTVLFVSHNMAAVENLCTRGIWIDGGKVVMDDATRPVMEAYMGTFADSQPSGTDLSAVQGRRGSGEIRYTALEFLHPDGSPLQLLRAGDSVVVRMRYKAHSEVAHPSFGFRLLTELGTLVTETSTWHHDLEIPVVTAGEGYVDLQIDALNLIPGRYYLSAGLSGAGGHVFDWVDHCARLEIEQSNIYNAGRTFDSRFGIAFFPQRWNLSGVQGGG